MFNRLLNKQIRKKLGGIENVPPQMMEFLETISDSYDHFEKDRIIIERAMYLELKESRLQKKQGKLEARSEFLSTMSHEIRTPLNAVVGISNVLLMESKDPETIDNLKTLKFSADTLLTLINNVLDFSKFEKGHIALENSEFNLRELITNLRSTFLAKSNSLGIDFILDICDEVPNVVSGDAHRLGQILLNLIGNAFKFTKQGYVRIRIRTIQKYDGKIELEFNIEDTGIGIPESKYELIFENFEQADLDTTRKYGGTGLGLPIAKKILEMMGSNINLESEVNKGTRFHFNLEFDIPTPKERVSKEIIENAVFTNQRILLVDDNKINLMIAKRFLEKWELEVVTALDGKEAYDKVQTGDYELILMDLNMPVMDGYESSKKIRSLKDKSKSNIPIIALTASADDNSKKRIFEYEMNDFMVKPFEPSELNKLLQEYLSSTNNQEARATQ